MNIFSKRSHREEVPQWKKDHPTWKFDHHAAGVKAMATAQGRYGLNYPERIGRKGGNISKGGKFGTDHAFALAMARKSVELRRARKEAQAK